VRIEHQEGVASIMLPYREPNRRPMPGAAHDGQPIPAHVRQAFAQAAHYFPTPLQQFQFFDKYARFNHALGRRETWIETVDRAVAFLHELAGDRLPVATYARIRQAILELRVMPSRRRLAMAGPAARRSHVAIYNCAYLPVDSLDSFVEALIILMSGCGVGFSVERQYVARLPQITHQTGAAPVRYIIEDSADGWAAALRCGLEEWFAGGDVQFDLSLLRPEGAPLLTKGGCASGPEPLRAMLALLRAHVLARQGDVLRPLDAHDMMCALGSAVGSGGVRRAAMLSLFDHDDEAMRRCKCGDFERAHPQRANANNSAVWPKGGPTQAAFMRQFLELVESRRGEPGIFNRDAALSMRPARRHASVFGINPCGEAVLRPMQFCNLSSVVVRSDDTVETLSEKVELATIIGTIQSLATHFPGLRPTWQQNCTEERLLGVDITGQLDSPIAQDAQVQVRLRHLAIETNRQVAQVLGINPSAAITCVKPSGNGSLLLDCAPGLHARWAPYYIRNVRIAASSPLLQVLRDAGAPMDPETGQTPEHAATWVVHFPVQAPEGAITRRERTAVQQCDYWLQNKLHWTEHNPSVTITYQPEEVPALMEWVWAHRHQIGGMTFLPASEARYAQMPYVEITRAEYERRAAAFPTIDFAALYRYEAGDQTTAAWAQACSGGVCELDT